MKSHYLILLAAIYGPFMHAGNALTTLKFEEGEQFALALSSLNFNRIDVEGERIIKISYPEKAFLIEQDKQDQEGLDGAVVLKPLAHIPLTLYVTTNRNHHFSITVTGSQDSGQTLKFVAKSLKGFHYEQAKEKASYQTSDLMTAMMEGNTPSGYREMAIKPTSFQLQKALKVTLVKQYQGKDNSGFVYRIENQSKMPVALTPALFDNPQLLSMELSEDLLAPSQEGYFYGIYRDRPKLG